jgi:hypothetical protein
MNIKPIFLAYTLHDSSSDCPPSKYKSYDLAVDAVNEFFNSYDFELKNGLPYDDGNSSYEDDPDGYIVFSEVKMHDGKISQFTHCGGDGPLAWIEKV